MTLRNQLRLLTLAWVPTFVLLANLIGRVVFDPFQHDPLPLTVYLAYFSPLAAYAVGLVWMWRIAGSVD
jgi:hypothetical protein